MKKLLQTTGLIFAMLLLANVGMAQTYPILDPINGVSGVEISPILIVEFDEEPTFGEDKYIEISSYDYNQIIKLYTGKAATTSPRPRPAMPNDIRLTIEENSLIIDLSGMELMASTVFYIEFPLGAIKFGGTEWDGFISNDPEDIWSFTTGAAPVDPEAPTINTVTPSPGASGISINTSFTVDFDSESDIQLGSNGFFKIKRKDDNVLKLPFLNGMGEINVSGNQLNIDATNSNLDYNTTYYVEISSDFIQNFPGISDPSYWTFTTETAPPKWAENYPTLTQSSTGFTFKGKSDLAGIYYFVVTGSLTPPSKEQIKAGINSSGGNAFKSFNANMIGNDEFSTNMDFTPELLKGNSYYLHALVASGDGKNGTVETRSIDRIPPSINDVSSYPINGYDLFPVKDNIRIVFSEKVFNHNGEVTELTSASFSLTKDGDTVAFDFAVSLDGTEITLTPKSPLSGNTEYTVVISPLSDEFYNVMTSSVTRTFYTDKLNVWNGNSSSLWGDAGNWQEPYITGKSVLIPDSLTHHYPVIDSDITVNNFTIEAGAVLTQTGGAIKVLGDFDLLSSEVTNASYLPKGGTLDVTGETRVYQHIVPGLGTTVSYLMGAPTIGTTNTNIGTIYRVKYYDNPTDDWFAINTNPMVPGRGYLVYAVNDLVFSGDINRSEKTLSLDRTNGKGYGWNVMGNPFTAGMKWGDLDIDTDTDTAKVENNYWIWNTHNKVYNAFNQEVGVGLELDGTIPSNHGFLVKLKIGETTGNITFKPEAMVANNTNYLKSASTSQFPHMKISAGNAEFTDLLAVAFVPDASPGVDRYDTEKFFGSGNPFQIFTVEGSMRLSINSLPDAGEKTTINLGYRSSRVGSYTIQLKEDHLEHSEVLLTDNKEEITVDLLYDGAYNFNVDRKETNSTRFTLTFPARISTVVEKNVPINNMNIYLKDGDVIVDVLDETETLTYEMVGVTGSLVGRGKLFSGVNNLGKFPSGLYIVNTRNGEGTIVSKKLLVYR